MSFKTQFNQKNDKFEIIIGHNYIKLNFLQDYMIN